VPGHYKTSYSQVKIYHYGGGVLLLTTFRPTEMILGGPLEDFDIVYRYHDDEDHGNRNAITEIGGLLNSGGWVGECYFGGNTGLAWRFSEGSRNFGLPFKYGVLTNDSSGYDGYISIDDENGGNINYANIHTHRSSVMESRMVKGRKERFRGVVIWDTNTDYYIKWYN
jgi:hypothetical protein